ncbi:hypothetical protein COCC4DRAFT_205550 [Bipolaris maydis ATCC 48331]|uniref:Histidine kinase n=3 Tax=Cochliobolus heterostrophus TaxID=5016 RepID=M2UDI5_COCH5|nr:uncharacterized protein COCC4DRAFT_205550 [Bipolaris maydis ATCC 48331]AAR29886.1 putative histidine kinase HHK7p [Bipolaris maydis]EMD96619.1 hypothetical protein COCHEDRAFT_106233 [Bipolaris maydis C5]ENI00557.1 hypothetical protein COCC4DRAFT_205550 [Bipolaris maydis ATCC 48331]KAJ5031498.1 hypothetical protein J3E73DRAFT_428624 [Bipolaris maydis]KAJ5060458.1 putative histidine kinase HHK7p [Bipolaris maydis]
MSQSPTSRGATKKSRYDMKRERNVRLHYGAAFCNIPRVDNLATHVPHPSHDSTLTALCQLTAIRMGGQRAMISILEEERQHILAEATCDSLLHPDTTKEAQGSLWAGSVSIPRNLALCENVLDLSGENNVLVINDLVEHKKADLQGAVYSNPDARFYASIALVSPDDTIVGTLCVFHNQPRDGLTSEQLSLFKDLASTVIGYLDTYTIRDQYSRGERFTRGLVSFVEGATTLLPFEHTEQQNPSSTPQESPDLSSETKGDPLSTYGRGRTEVDDPSPDNSPSPTHKATTARFARHQAIGTLQDAILPMDSKSMFSRAANVMMASSNLDGVLILDASVAANGGQQRSNTTSRTRSSVDSLSESYQCKVVTDLTRNLTGQSLAVAVSSEKQKSAFGSLLESDLARMLHGYPHGKIFTFTASDIFVSSDETTSSPYFTEELPRMASSKRQTKNWSKRCSEAIQTMFPEAASVAFVPFWDFERSRWFAGCLCWSDNPHRLLSPSVDLVYFKIFSNSIMRELSRLDAMALDQAKSTFVASISHELRSPLHGILGTLEFFKDTPLDSFQAGLLSSLHGCGTTLLDTINQVMDYGKISESRNSISSKRIKSDNTIRLSCKPVKSRRKRDPAFDIGTATEEAVEAVFIGSSYVPVTAKHIEELPSRTAHESTPLPKRNVCFVILEVAYEDDWIFSFPIGSWRRIVMNLFGNAVKYTESGYVHVSLRSSKSAENANAPTTVILTITDTGLGMSPSFLANRIFEPFSQENPHSPGTGLGLSIVRQIIDMSGGKIEVSSQPSIGSKVTVKLALTHSESSDLLMAEHRRFQSTLSRLHGYRICILSKKTTSSPEDADYSRAEEGLVRFTNALANTLEKHLKMDVVKSTDSEYNGADIVICPEVSFDYLDIVRRRRTRDQRVPVIIFIGMDALAAATLRSDVRVTSKQSVVEVITQPCGPHKLAFVLNRCLDRYDQPDDNVQPSRAVSPLPQTATHGVEELRISVPPPSPAQPNDRSSQARSAKNATKSPTATPTAEEELTASHILIVDDNMLNRRLLVAFMNKNDLQHQEASDGLEALRKYQADPHKFEVIIMDMSMPVMDGMAATRAIRKHEQNHNLPRSCIIALTGLTSSSARLEAWSSGIDHYITKPVNYQKLRELLKSEKSRKDGRRRSVEVPDKATEEAAEDVA